MEISFDFSTDVFYKKPTCFFRKFEEDYYKYHVEFTWLWFEIIFSLINKKD